MPRRRRRAVRRAPLTAPAGSSSSPSRRRDHAARHALPRPALAHGRDEPRARLSPQRRSAAQPAGDALGERRDGAVVDGEASSHGGRRRGTACGERVAHLGEPRVRGADRQHAARGGLGRDHPERLGERARHDQRAACGQQLGELVVLEAPGEHDPLAERRGRREVALARSPSSPSRNASRCRSGALARRCVPLERAPGARDLARAARGRRPRARRAAARAPSR